MLLNTICFLVKKSGNQIDQILMARKKIGFGAGKIVGVGGTVEEGETIPHATIRELHEELNIRVAEKDLKRAAKLTFHFPAKPEWDRIVFVYLAECWQGQLQESDEVVPQWFAPADIPYSEMWADGKHWLPPVLSGQRTIGRFSFQADNETLDTIEVKEDQDYLWPHLKVLPYFRSMLRAVEASQYQDLDLPAPVLDVGSGDGLFADLVFDFKLDVGLDPWWEPLVESRQFPDSYNGLVQADGARSPFPDETFASALSNSVLEHIEHLDDVLADTARVLKPGAPFIFCCPNAEYYNKLSLPAFLRKLGLKKLAKAYADWFMKMSRTINADMPDVWEARLEKAGFTLERWWHYFPKESLHMLEWGHYFGAPTLLAKKLLGRWLFAPTRWNLWLTERIVRPYTATEPHPQGTYTFFIARKKGD